ncbi:hybrid sensor histidine kinase/response regulator [Pseudobutyrivibrio sp. 49]|uniref:hybrid sensor histidine kinase/response regulator n=1 Tax=Pseudobutyrivibrio sp. 49 TaxID=1855344 RepID=UPI00159F9E13|nr:hybrid sensor histidine kinase/response regulator [Pseudobutyrivibrio sp. 49]
MKKIKLIALLGLISLIGLNFKLYAEETEEENIYQVYGGGYAVTEQIPGVGYSSKLYDSSNGLPTSDSMCILGESDGHVWIGGYSGVTTYDGTNFQRLSTDEGLTSARGMLEDSKGRIWVGTNDNGVVVIEGEKRTQLTYLDGLPSSSIRYFVEDFKGNIFVGTTAGVCYVNTDMEVCLLEDKRLNEERVLKLDIDSEGRIYGQTSSGIIFAIDNCQITELYRSEDLGLDQITTIMADPNVPGHVYLGTTGEYVYYGKFGDKLNRFKKIDVHPVTNIHWINYDCGRVWISSTNKIGYLDENFQFVLLDVDIESGIEMLTSDYQGNIWISSSTLGAVKVVANNYVNLCEKAGLNHVVTNATCDYDGYLYLGTDQGIQILGKDGVVTEHPLMDYIEDARVRCIKEDDKGNLWVATYTKSKGLVCMDKDGNITRYTTQNGLPNNQVRCIAFAKDGSTLVGTNDGLTIIRDGQVVENYGEKQGIKNPVFLCVEEMEDGFVWCGSDGDGIYAIKGKIVKHISREDGLTSDVIMKIKRDDAHGVTWLITSNSIQLVKDETISSITSFPYNNNYDIYFDDHGNAWILSSYGVFSVNAEDMLKDKITEYRLDTVENGLPFALTSNLYCDSDDEGNLYIPGRDGTIKVNFNNYYTAFGKFKMMIGSVYCGDELIKPDDKGLYTIPASTGRIQINPSVMDYTTLNPTIKMFLEGASDEGVTIQKSKMSSLEYTSLPYGDYTLHLQVIDPTTETVLQDETFSIKKSPRLGELWAFRIFILALIAIATAVIVWRVMGTTIIRRQYIEISKAKEEAERANLSKSRFLANMSHEIRTPINTIMGMNEMVMREDARGVPKDYFMSMMNYAFDIRNATESLLGLINDLLDISKIESGKMHLVEQEYDVQDMLRSIVSMIRVRSIEKELTFDVVVDEIMPKRLYGDMGKIKQIVLNLLTNAVKYTEKGGFILNVSMDARENEVCSLRISVKDTGIGVKDEDMERLFTAYERLDEERNVAIQGTGLGLDISRRFAELMSGQLWCESTYGEGSEFILTLNQKIVDATPIGLFLEHEDTGAKGPYVPQFIAPDADILVVDDNPMNLNVIKGLLKATRVFVTTSTSGEDAIDKIRVNHFDIILLDHMMPGMDGIETLEKIREFEPEVPVYALTANSTAGEDFYVSKGFNGYLAKPVEPEILEKTILRHLPESMVEKFTRDETVEELKELPENMLWINSVEGISVDDGIKNSGGIESFIFALDLFLDTIDSNTRVITDAYEEGNVRLYTIKIHALKSSCRIIGALELSNLAAQLEDAGNRNDVEFIDANNAAFIEQYNEFKDKLKAINGVMADDDGKEPVPEDMLSDAYNALAEVIPQMDFDAVSMILDGLMEYKLPEEDAIRIYDLSKMLKVFDWDAMEEWLENK